MTKIPIRWLEPHEFPEPLTWLMFYTHQCDERPHFLAKPRSAVPAVTDPLTRSIDGITA